MKASHPNLDSAADEQASLWAARLDGSPLSALDRAALDAWLNEHPSHRSLLSEYCQFSTDLEEQLPALVSAGIITMPEVKKPRRRFIRSIWLASAALAAAAAIAVMVQPAPLTPTKFENLATAAGQRQSFTLPDGTRVQLNAQTSLAMDNSGAQRRVQLANGEAFFEVSKDLSRPFIVETPAGSVRVTGTQFNVHSEAGFPFEVTVLEGSVQVRPSMATGVNPSAPFNLGPGDQLSADATGVAVQTLARNVLENVLAWRQGQAVFDGTPLREALARFARYHGRGITTTTEAGNLRVGGRFSLDDLDGFFAALEEILPVQVSRDLSGTVQVGLRSGP